MDVVCESMIAVEEMESYDLRTGGMCGFSSLPVSI